MPFEISYISNLLIPKLPLSFVKIGALLFSGKNLDLREDCNYPLDTGSKLKLHNMFRRLPGHLLNVLYAFSVPLMSRGYSHCNIGKILRKKPFQTNKLELSINKNLAHATIVWNNGSYNITTLNFTESSFVIHIVNVLSKIYTK